MTKKHLSRLSRSSELSDFSGRSLQSRQSSYPEHSASKDTQRFPFQLPEPWQTELQRGKLKFILWMRKQDKAVWRLYHAKSDGPKESDKSGITPGGWALKVSPKPLAHWRTTRTICERLRKAGGPVPRIGHVWQAGRKGSAQKDTARTLILSEWVGKSEPSEFNLEDIRRMVQALASLHRSSRTINPDEFPQIRRMTGGWTERYSRFLKKMELRIRSVSDSGKGPQADWIRKHGHGWLEQATQAVRLLNGSAYRQDSALHHKRPVLCHQDFSPGNLRNVQGKVLAIDWDSLVWDSPVRDLRKLMIKIASERGWRGKWPQLFLQAYHSFSPLADYTIDVLRADLMFPHRVYGWIKSVHRLQKGRLTVRQKHHAGMPWLIRILSEEKDRLRAVRNLR